MERGISRREFLKLLASGTAVLALGPLFANLGRFSKLSSKNNESTSSSILPGLAYAQSAGSWQMGQNTTSNAIHAAVLPNGKILYVAGSGYHKDRPNGPFTATVLDLSSGSETNVPLNED